MDAILGIISEIVVRGAEAGLRRATVTLTPACLLPARAAVPAWLADASLTVERRVADLRELGTVGDSIVLSPAESARWLHPLRVEPVVATGSPPETLALSLHWWREAPPPPFTVSGPGGTITGAFQQAGDDYTAEVATHGLLPDGQPLPAEITVTCGAFSTACGVLPDTPFVMRLRLSTSMVYRLQNMWTTVDVVGHIGGGALVDWWERGRGMNHFTRPPDRIQAPLEYAGLMDRFIMSEHPSEQLGGLALPEAREWQDTQALYLRLSGTVDKSLGLSTAVTCALATDLPLLRWERAFHFADQHKQRAPHVPVDDIRGFGQGIRVAWLTERALTGSRVLLCARDGRLLALRSPAPLYHAHPQGWSPRDGWVLVEHPYRHAFTLFLFDPALPAHLGLRLTPLSCMLEVNWPLAPAFPGSHFTRPLAMAAGECSSAEPAGAWIACRIPTPDGVRCALIGRWRDVLPDAVAFTVGGYRATAAPRRMALPGIGEIASAVTDCPGGTMTAPFTVEVA